MHRWITLLFIAASTALAADAAPPLPGPDGKPLSAAEIRRLESGKVFSLLVEAPESPVKEARAMGLLDAPPEVVMASLLDFERFSEFMAYVKTTEVLGEKDGVTRVKYFLDLTWPVGNRHYVLLMSSEEKEVDGVITLRSKWSYEAGSGNINDTKGYWELTPYGEGKTLARYVVLTDPGGNTPKYLKNKAAAVAVPKVYKGLRKEVARALREKEEDDKNGR